MTPADAKPNAISAEAKLSAEAALSSAREPAAWQFSLLALFELTTAAAIAAALVAAKGWGTLVLSTGLTLVWFNVRGSFTYWQTPRRQIWLFGAAWILFAVSLALPVLHVMSTYTYGWEAAVTIAHVEWESVTRDGVTKIFSSNNLSAKYALSGVLSFCQITLMNGANLLILLSPLTLWRLRRGKGIRLANCQAVMSVTAWVVPFGDSSFLVGCYVWCASMMLPLIARRVTWLVAVAMVAIALMFGVATWLENMNL